MARERFDHRTARIKNWKIESQTKRTQNWRVSDSGIALQSRLIRWDFPSLILNQTAKLEVFVEALYSRKLEAVLCCATGDEIFRRFGVAIRKLHVFSGREMIGEPRLTAFGLPPDPISEDEAFVGVTLFLHLFGV